MEAQRFLPAAEFWVWSLSGPNVGQASAPLFRIHLECGVSTSFSQEHRPCSKLQRSSNPFGSNLLLVKKKKAKTLKFTISLKWKLWFYCFFPLLSIVKCLISITLLLRLFGNLTTVDLIWVVPTVIAVVAQLVGLHAHTVDALEHVVRTCRLRLCEGIQRL